MLWFADKMISIPHISYIEELDPEYTHELPELPELSEEEHEKARLKVNEIRAKLKSRLKAID